MAYACSLLFFDFRATILSIPNNNLLHFKKEAKISPTIIKWEKNHNTSYNLLETKNKMIHLQTSTVTKGKTLK